MKLWHLIAFVGLGFIVLSLSGCRTLVDNWEISQKARPDGIGGYVIY